MRKWITDALSELAGGFIAAALLFFALAIYGATLHP